MSRLEHLAPVLTQCATMDGLRQNSFRVFGLRVDLPTKKLESALQDLRVALDLGDDLKHAFATKRPEEGVSRQATQRLKDPVLRICDECFWFWPMDLGAEDVALDYVAGGDTGRASEEWRQFLDHPEWGPIASHNLAVLSLHESIESEMLEEDFGRHASLFLRSDACLNRIKARLRDLDDPRLPRTAGGDFMEEWRRALTKAETRQAVAALQSGRTTEAQRRVRRAQLVAGSDALLSEIAEAEFEVELRDLEKRCQLAPESMKDGEWQDLVNRTQRLMGNMRFFPSLEGRAEIAGNESAGFLRSVSLHANNMLNDVNRALLIAESAKILASGGRLRQINEDISTLKGIVEQRDSEAQLKSVAKKIKGICDSPGSASDRQVVNALNILNRLADKARNEELRQLLKILYSNLGFAMLGSAIGAYNQNNDETRAEELLNLSQRIADSSNDRGITQPDLFRKIFENRMILENIGRIRQSNQRRYEQSSSSSCLLMLVALLCLTGAASYAAVAATSATKDWMATHLK